MFKKSVVFLMVVFLMVVCVGVSFAENRNCGNNGNGNYGNCNGNRDYSNYYGNSHNNRNRNENRVVKSDSWYTQNLSIPFVKCWEDYEGPAYIEMVIRYFSPSAGAGDVERGLYNWYAARNDFAPESISIVTVIKALREYGNLNVDYITQAEILDLVNAASNGYPVITHMNDDTFRVVRGVSGGVVKVNNEHIGADLDFDVFDFIDEWSGMAIIIKGQIEQENEEEEEESLVDDLDTDGDGKVSADEAKEAMGCFIGTLSL